MAAFLFMHVMAIKIVEQRLGDYRRLRIRPERSSPRLTTRPSNWLITLTMSTLLANDLIRLCETQNPLWHHAILREQGFDLSLVEQLGALPIFVDGR